LAAHSHCDVLQHVSHFAVYLLMLLPCSVAGIHFLMAWLFIMQSGVGRFEPTRLLLGRLCGRENLFV
jgi:hypothetical protein